MDFYAESFGGDGNCRLGLEIRPLGGTFAFLASVSGVPNLKLAGSTTLTAIKYPPGEYEVRFFYECGPTANDRTLMDQSLYTVLVHPVPILDPNVQVEYDGCSNQDFSIALSELIQPLPPEYSTKFLIDGIQYVSDTLNASFENKTNAPVLFPVLVEPYSCIPPICITQIRVGGQQGDNYIGPTCNGNGTYRTCFYITGKNLPVYPSSYTVVLNGVSYVPAFVQKLDLENAVVCLAAVVPQGSADITISISDCEYTVEDLFQEPDCSSPASCLTDFRIGGQQGDNYVGPTCNPDGTYLTTFYVSGPNLPNNGGQYALEINGVIYPITFFQLLSPSSAVIGVQRIVAQDSADVTIAINGICVLTKLNLYEEPDCSLPMDCITSFRPGGQPGDQYIGPTCNDDGTYRVAFYVTGVALPQNVSDYKLDINGVEYLPQFFQVLNSSQLVLGFMNLPATGELTDPKIIVRDGECMLLIEDLYTAPMCPVAILEDKLKTALAPGDEFINDNSFCCPGQPFTLLLTVYPEPVGMNDTVSVFTCNDVAYDCQNNVNTLGNNLPAFFTWTPTYDPSVVSIVSNGNSGSIITDVLTNLTDAIQTVSYLIVPQAAGPDGMLESGDDCVGDSFLLTSIYCQDQTFLLALSA